MKKMHLFPVVLMACSLFTANQMISGSGYSTEGKYQDTIKINSFSGKVIDAKTNDALPFANVEAVGTTVSTITNIDGEFVIKVPLRSNINELKITYLGYANKDIRLNDFTEKKYLTIKMDLNPVLLSQVIVRPLDATDIIDRVLNKVSQNYGDKSMMMKAFYRETIKKGNNYVSVAEAVVDISKAPYDNVTQSDKLWINKGRKSSQVEKMDTLLFKLQGGPAVSMLLDIAKNPYLVLTDKYQSVYDFKMGEIINIDNKLHYVILFNQKPEVDAPYFKGKLFIEIESLAISEAEFSLNVENKEEAALLFIKKKPGGLQ